MLCLMKTSIHSFIDLFYQKGFLDTLDSFAMLMIYSPSLACTKPHNGLILSSNLLIRDQDVVVMKYCRDKLWIYLEGTAVQVKF